MYSVKEIAIWFIYKNNVEIKEQEATTKGENYEVYEGITHLKLQKLLYYAQGISLSMNNIPLFSEKIEAWEHGPVIKEVFKEYKEFGKECITVEINDENNAIVNKIENDNKCKEILNIVYYNFAIYTAWQLREMTHEKGTPWDITVNKKAENKYITNDLIKKYFIEYIMEN